MAPDLVQQLSRKGYVAAAAFPPWILSDVRVGLYRIHVNCFHCFLLTLALSSLLPFADGWRRYTISTAVLKKARVLLDTKLDA
jgi:hypothetical protein